MSLRAPLGRVLGLGSARGGTDHWWGQRISGVALVLLGLWFAGSLHGLGPLEHGAVLMFIAMPLNTVLLSLLCLVVAWHSSAHFVAGQVGTTTHVFRHERATGQTSIVSASGVSSS